VTNTRRDLGPIPKVQVALSVETTSIWNVGMACAP